ncbi:GNAT family N-acetyltransferase [Companilactobacillus mishanensis]|uniref:GNAT family N-acetyltransferase n=1 Tax=Companilactobacillus mishanensis TaxID=2486008 RepID=A0ABW9P905_9LACO|nr:GNAT family N-acetyltransferase [Companilactobacillus mishanensis]MQS45725.1 GNAT family N-acetyltransferase [Companilactobacillus mishanensis]
MDLQGEKLVIRNFTEADEKEFYKLMSSKKNHDTAGLEYSTDQNFVKKVFSQYLALANTYAIALKSNSQMVGIIELNERGISNGLDKTREIGFIISEEYRHLGYAQEAISLLLDYGFNTLHLTEVWASVKLHNLIPQTLLTQLGFKYIYQANQDPFLSDDDDEILKYYLLKNEQNADE